MKKEKEKPPPPTPTSANKVTASLDCVYWQVNLQYFLVRYKLFEFCQFLTTGTVWLKLSSTWLCCPPVHFWWLETIPGGCFTTIYPITGRFCGVWLRSSLTKTWLWNDWVKGNAYLWMSCPKVPFCFCKGLSPLFVTVHACVPLPLQSIRCCLYKTSCQFRVQKLILKRV